MYIIFIKMSSYKMPKTKTPFPLIIICGSILFYIVLANQNDNHEIKETKKKIEEQNGCGIVQVETIGYLKNVKKLDLILNFLHCNKNLGFGQLEYHMERLIARSRGQNIGRQYDIRFICKAEDIQQKIDKNSCWFCQKQFKNQTYLAVHYAVRHLHQVSPFSLCNNLTHLSQLSLPVQSEIELILSQLLYKIVSPHELRILFSSLAPQKQVLILCQQIFARVMKAYSAHGTSIDILLDRYGPFFRKNRSDELCMIIALKMGQKTIWINVFRYVALFFLILFGLSYCIYFIMKMLSKVDKQIYESRFKRN